MRKSIAVAALLGEISAVQIKQMVDSEFPVVVDIPANFIATPYDFKSDFSSMDNDMKRMNQELNKKMAEAWERDSHFKSTSNLNDMKTY